MTAIADISPIASAVGSRYRRTLTWNSKTLVSLGMPEFTAFRKFTRPRYVFDIEWNYLTLAQAQTYERMFRVARATKFTFLWLDWFPWWWESVFFGTGDGVTTRWILPAKGVLDVAIFSGGATSGGGSDRAAITSTVVSGIGPDGEDAVDLAAALPSTRPGWAYFYGRRFFTVTFAADTAIKATRDLQTGFYGLTTKLIQSKSQAGT